MKKVPVKVLSAAAALALLSAPIAPYAVQAANQETAPADGFYVVKKDGSKLYFTMDELVDNTSVVADAIDAAGMENVYFLEDGNAVNLDGLFEGDDLVPYQPGDVPAGDYTSTSGTKVSVETTPVIFEVTEIASVDKNGVTVKLDVPPISAPTADKFNVTVGGEAVVVTAVTADTTDSTGTIFKLAVDLDGKKGTVAVNGKEKAFDFTAVAVELVSAINKKEVTVTFPSDSAIEESDLTGKEITLTGGNDQTLTAEFTSFDEATKTAVFSLAEGSALVDATTYTVNGEGFTFTEDSFQARFGPTVATTYTAVTTAITEGATAKVYIEAKDQYGESIEVPADVVVSGTLNELPLTEEELSYNATSKAIEVTIALNVDDVLVMNVGGTELTFTVIEEAPSELKSFKIQAPTTVKSGETASMVVIARDQFNNPVTPEEGQVRWTVNGKIIAEQNEARYVFDKKEAGQYEVKAYYMVNGKINATASITVTVETADLTTAIAEANDVEDLGYTTATWEAFQTALADAKTVAANAKATQTEIDGALANLEAAKEGLVDATPELTEANIKVGADVVEFTSVSGATATLDLTDLASESTATVAKVTASEAATLELTYGGVSKKVELVKGENTLSAADLIPGLKPTTPLTIAFLQNLDATGTLNVTTKLTDKTTEAGQAVTGVLTLVYDAK